MDDSSRDAVKLLEAVIRVRQTFEQARNAIRRRETVQISTHEFMHRVGENPRTRWFELIVSATLNDERMIDWCLSVSWDESRWELERELVYRHRFTTHSEARAAIFKYIEVFYNRKRRHSTLGYLSPADFETKQQQVAVN